MRSSLAAAALCNGIALAADYSPFLITSVYTKQPNGNPDGQTNFYNFLSQVNSTNGDSPQTGYCAAGWSDNNAGGSDPFSEYVPTGWTQCARSASDSNASEFSFQLYKPFGIGNFSVAIQQNLTQTTNGKPTQIIAQSNPFHITNTTSNFTCTINPGENPSFQVHANGECTTPSNFAGYSLPIVNVSSACTNTPATTVSLSFPVQERTNYGDNVFVVGNITQLGSWSPYHAVALSAAGYEDINTIWSGADAVSVPAGTAFEYKYIQWSSDGSLLWECGENRVASVALGTCGKQTIGNDPDYFRCGNH
ncbi:hypothetical protein LTR62_002215 [Meristemomyces frigidus]|uniref:CBM20 domain-containing protein n=1 Tax=Meristemomyces frigidus TaxID=1508187 RepID=A0AAN7TMB3_9PEZI|nr:hypothetical protein LTR62_002215 [Meristemomyces frigidus]